jgi:hypothetical protein
MCQLADRAAAVNYMIGNRYHIESGLAEDINDFLQPHGAVRVFRVYMEIT